jgi:hypothetical protein
LRVAKQRSLVVAPALGLGGGERLEHYLDLGVHLRQLLRNGLLDLEPDTVAKVLARDSHHEVARHVLAQAVTACASPCRACTCLE